MNRKLDRLIGIPLVWGSQFLGSRPADLSRPLKKILVIKLAAAGDTLLMVPVLRSIREAVPDSEIHWLASRVNASLARTVPYVHQVRVFDGGSLVRLIRKVRSEQYDAVLDFEQWARGTALLTRLSGAPIRIGFDTPGEHRAGAYDRTYRKRFDQHEIDDFFGLSELLCPLERLRELEFWETEDGRQQASSALDGNDARLKALMHPGCGWDGTPREWPLDRYVRIGRWLMENYDARIFLTGGPEEKAKNDEVNHGLMGRGVNLAGKMSWYGTASLLKAMDLVISGNTGVMHLAAAMKRPQIALHGPTNPLLWGPINDKAVVVQSKCQLCPCLKLGFEYHRHDSQCMESISLEEVVVQAEYLIETYAGVRPSPAMRSEVETEAAAWSST